MRHAHFERSPQTDMSVHGNHAPVARGGDARVEGVQPGLFWANTLIAGLAIAFGCWAIYQANITERETRMLEYYVMELDGKLMKQGIIDPSQSWAAQKRKREEQSK